MVYLKVPFAVYSVIKAAAQYDRPSFHGATVYISYGFCRKVRVAPVTPRWVTASALSS